MVADVGRAEVVKHHAPARQRFVAVRLAAVQQVGVPEKYVTFFGQEYLLLQAQRGYPALDKLFVGGLAFVADEPGRTFILVVGVEVIGQDMAAGEVVQRAVSS